MRFHNNKTIFLTLRLFAATTAIQAQVKIGDNPATLAPTTVLQVEKNNNQVVVDNNGNVGIGTLTPSHGLNLSGEGNKGAISVERFSSLNSEPAILRLRKASGTKAAPTTVVANNLIGGMYMDGWDGTTWASGAAVVAIARENFSGTNHGTGIDFRVRESTSSAINVAMRVDHNSNIGIGSNAPAQRLEIAPVGLPTTASEIKADISALNGGDGLIFGHNNPLYTGTLGAISGNGAPYLQFYAKHSNIANESRFSSSTGSFPGRILADAGGNDNIFSFQGTSAALATNDVITWQDMMVINKAGKVAIGATVPLARLDVSDTQLGGGTAAIIAKNSTYGIAVPPSDVRAAIAGFGHYSTTPGIVTTGIYGNVPLGGHLASTSAAIFDRMDSNRRIFIGGSFTATVNSPSIQVYNTSTGATDFVVDNTGYVGIGLAAPGHPLQMGSGAFCTAAGVWTDASDRRLKTNISDLSYGLREVMRLRPVSYNMKKGGTAQVGFIAQEVQKVLPEVVAGQEGNVEKGETLGLAYGNMVAVLTKAMQEQQGQIEALQKEITVLKEKEAGVEKLKAELAEIRALVQKNTVTNR